jgi:hypothetical protein
MLQARLETIKSAAPTAPMGHSSKMKSFKPYLVTAGVVIVTLLVVKMIKPSLPSALAQFLP